MESIWRKTAELPHFPPLEGNLKTDVLVIGGGMAGLLCAWRLAQAGVNCTLVEAGRICGGTTGNTTAKLTCQHGLIYDKLIRTFGLERARLYLEGNQAALDCFRQLCQTIDCDFEEQDSFVYSRNSRKKLDKELIALNRLGAQAELAENLPLPFSTAGAVRLRRQAQFHPLKFAAAIAKGLPIFEHTRVLELAPGRAVTSRGFIQAEAIIAATHFPMLNKHGWYFLKLYQHRSYVLALENAPALDGMYVDEASGGLSFRGWRGRLLLGGGAHRTGKPGGGWEPLERFARRRYPESQVSARWAAQDCMSLDRVPYIGLYSKGTARLYTASGFNKWGMTSSMLSAMLLSDLLLNRNSPYAQIFSPSRSVLRSQLAANALESVMGLLTPTAPRCPHMGCALKYNAAEHSWDCPCHGSRFEEDGTLIENPANTSRNAPE